MSDKTQIDATTRCQHCETLAGVSVAWFGMAVECPACKKSFSFQTVVSSPSDTLSNATLQTIKVAKLSQRKSAAPDISIKSGFKRLASTGKIGRYEVKSVLGEGAFGLVYLAFDPELSRDVAIKLPRLTNTLGESDGSTSSLVRQRFQREARAAARLRHPGIVAVFDHGQNDKGVFIVYEYIPGQTLEEVMKEGKLEIREFLQKVCAIADALSYAAAEGIVHRDIKPANIMIDSRGRPQIMDFGLAEAALSGQASTGGRIAGTPAYMSPEQARGNETITPASDQYSLGAILYEHITGIRSTTHRGAAAISEIANRDSIPLQPLSSIPIDLACIIRKAMSVIPSDRYPDCHDLATDLRAYLTGFPVAARRNYLWVRFGKWSQRNRLSAGLLVALFLMLLGIATMSSAVAVSNKWRNTRLAAALDLAEKQSKEAEFQAGEAKRQATIASQKEQAAIKSETEAKRARDAAQLALEGERKAREDQRNAELVAKAETEQNAATGAKLVVVESDLQIRTKQVTEMQYAQLLQQAAVSIRRGEMSRARNLLGECIEKQRGWEWNWLQQDTEKERKYVPLKDIPREYYEQMMYPIAFQQSTLGKPFVHTPFSLKPDWLTDNRVRFGDSGDLGVMPYPIRLSNAAQSNILLRMLDFRLGTKVDFSTADQVRSIQILNGNKYVAVTLARTTPGGANGSAKPLFYSEVWSCTSVPKRVLQTEISGEWIPSYLHIPDRKILLEARTETDLVSWDLDRGEVKQKVQLTDSIHQGPGALALTSEGAILAITQSKQTIVIDPSNMTSTKIIYQGAGVVDRSKFVWDLTKRYVAFFEPETLRYVVGQPDQDGEKQKFGSDLKYQRTVQLCELQTGVILGEIPAPMSEIVVVPAENALNIPRISVPINLGRRVLSIEKLLVVDSGSSLVLRDSQGVISGWTLGNSVGVMSVDIEGVRQISDSVFCEQGMVVLSDEKTYILEAGSISDTGRPRKPIAVARKRRTQVKALVASDSPTTFAVLDNESRVALFVNSRLTAEIPLPQATVMCFSASGRYLHVGTGEGKLYTISTMEGKVIREDTIHAGAVTAMVSIPEFGQLATAGNDLAIKLWDTLTGSQVESKVFFMNEPAVTFCYEGKTRLLAASGGSTLTIFGHPSHGELFVSSSGTLPHTCKYMAFMPDGSRLLAADQRSLSIVDVRTAIRLYTLPQLSVDIKGVSVVNAIPTAVLTDGTIRLWKLENAVRN